MARHPNPSEPRASGTDITFAALRLGVSVILIWGALTKLLDGERLNRLVEVWAAAGLPQAGLFVAASIGLQLILALLLLVGLFTRAAGLINGVNFAAAAALTGIFTGANWWPFLLLVILLIHFGVVGAGSLSIDGMRRRRLAAAARLEEPTVEELMASIGVKPRSPDGNADRSDHTR